MKKRLFLIVACSAIISAFGSQNSLIAQKAEIINRSTLPSIERGLGIGDPAPVSGPAADLVIKDMCFDEKTPGNGTSSVKVLIGNMGTVDAGPFELGFEYISSDRKSTLALDKIPGLRAGDQRWVVEAHYCCAGFLGSFLLDSSVRVQAIADAKYYTQDFFHPLERVEVKPVIPETNESNNKMAANKSDLRSCTTVKKIETPTLPKVQPVRPPRP